MLSNHTRAAGLVLKRMMQNTSAIASSRSMSSTAKVWVDKNTRVICQGFTGKQVRTRNSSVYSHLLRILVVAV